LIFGFIIIGLLLITVGYLSFLSTRGLERISQAILRENVSSLKAAQELALALVDQKGLVSNYLLDGDERWLDLLEEKKGVFRDWFDKADEVALIEKEKEALKEIARLYIHYDGLRSQVINFYRLGNFEEAKRLLLSEVKDYLDQLHEECENLLLINEELIAQAQKGTERFIFRIRLAVWFTIGIAIALGSALGFLIFRTITKRLLEIEKMASLGKLSATVAHEIRNPLTAIKIRTQALKGEVQERSQWREDLEVIEEEILRLEKIVSDFVILAKPSKLNLNRESINGVIESAIEVLKPKIETQGIELRKYLGEDIGINLDREKIKQALLNLFMNSLEAMPEGGNLEVSTSLNRDYLEIKIKDSGRGLSKKGRRRLFEPFFTTKKDGLGLGLSVVKNIVEMHKGKIKIDSQENKGTVFNIILPV